MIAGHDTREAAQAECDRANAPFRGVTLTERRCGNCGETDHTAAAKRCPSRPDVAREAVYAALSEPRSGSALREMLGPKIRPRAVEDALYRLSGLRRVRRGERLGRDFMWSRVAVLP